VLLLKKKTACRCYLVSNHTGRRDAPHHAVKPLEKSRSQVHDVNKEQEKTFFTYLKHYYSSIVARYGREQDPNVSLSASDLNI
jgi:hypothetical protein